MQVAITPPDELETTSNAFAAKEELAELTKTLQDIDYSTSPIEAAALQLTMRQVDKSMDLPSTESYNNNPSFFVTLVHEGLKEGIGKAWDVFIKSLIALYKRITAFCTKIFNKLRNGFKTTNFKKTETITEVKVTVPKHLAGWDGNVDSSTFSQRIDTCQKLITVVAGASELINFMSLSRATGNRDPQNFIEYCYSDIERSMGNVFGADAKGGKEGLTVELGDGASLVLDKDVNIIYPHLDVDDSQGEVEIVLNSSDVSKMYDDSRMKIPKLIRGAEKLLRATSFAKDQVETFGKLELPEAKELAMSLQAAFSARAKLLTQSFTYVNKIADVHNHIMEAIAKSEGESNASSN